MSVDGDIHVEDIRLDAGNERCVEHDAGQHCSLSQKVADGIVEADINVNVNNISVDHSTSPSDISGKVKDGGPVISTGNGDLGGKTVVYNHQNEHKGIAETVDANNSRAFSKANPFLTTDRTQGVKLRISKDTNDFSSCPAVTVMEKFDETVAKYPDVPALKVERGGQWSTWTYQQYSDDVRAIAKAFIKLGLEACNSVGIIGFNSPEWFMADLGAIYAGGLACGIYTTNTPEACLFVALDASMNIVVAENYAQADKFIQNWDKLPDLKAIILYNDELKEQGQKIYSWKEVIEMGRKEPDDALKERIQNQSANKCCTLIYTSGTTGNPKGVMFSHDNVTFGAKQTLRAMKGYVEIGCEQILSYLPLSHVAAQMVDIHCPYNVAATVWFARPDALKGSLAISLRTVRPTLFLGVPRVFEKIEETIRAAGRNITGVKRKLADWAKSIALRGNINKEQGRSVPYGWTIANALILKRVKQQLGLDRCKLPVTGAAPIQLETLRFFQSLNVPLYELYGMSECGCATLSMPHAFRTTSCGRANPGFEFKLLNQDKDGSGEVCMRGRPIFMGYLNNEEKTLETLDDDGWLHSGDVGKIDDDGYLFITGRIKELIITAGGENIAPVPIEDHIKAELPIISNAMVVGDKKKFLSVLLTFKVEMDPDTGASTDKLLPVSVSFCKNLGIDATLASQIVNNTPEALTKAVKEGIDRANEKAVSRASKIQKWTFLEKDFSVPGGELGPTLKVRRPQVLKMHKDKIDAMYAS